MYVLFDFVCMDFGVRELRITISKILAYKGIQTRRIPRTQRMCQPLRYWIGYLSNTLRNHCNIFWVDADIHSKNGGKTASCAKRMMHNFSLRFWCGYLQQPIKYYNDSLSFYFDAFKRQF